MNMPYLNIKIEFDPKVFEKISDKFNNSMKKTNERRSSNAY